MVTQEDTFDMEEKVVVVVMRVVVGRG